ncbi:MAG: histidine phosphatase family protein [Pseudomonadota bacterium]|jgi:phosphohistidine phosphatase
MRRLILFRHAKTEAQAQSGQDFDRRLTERGHSDAALMARLLADQGLSPDKVLVSAAARAQETWAAMSAAFPKAEAETQARLYLAPAEVLIQAAEDEVEADTVLILAHNPGLHDAALRLSRGARSVGPSRRKLEEGLPTATAAVFGIDAEGDGAAATLEAVLRPSDHGGGARK